MEVRGISQGVQTGYDYSNQNKNVESVQTVTAVKSSEANKASEGDKNNTKDTVNEKDLKKALDKLTKFMSDDNTKVEYEFHNKFNHDLMIRIVDKNTNQVLMESPPKKILDMIAKMMEVVGVFFDKKA